MLDGVYNEFWSTLLQNLQSVVIGGDTSTAFIGY
jgi:hypothetical protein